MALVSNSTGSAVAQQAPNQVDPFENLTDQQRKVVKRWELAQKIAAFVPPILFILSIVLLGLGVAGLINPLAGLYTFGASIGAWLFIVKPIDHFRSRKRKEYGLPAYDPALPRRRDNLNARANNGAQPNVPAQDGAQPNVPAQDGAQPNVPAQDGAQPNVPAQDGAQPNVPAQDGAQPNVPAQDGAQPNVPAQDGAQPNVPAQDGAQPNAQAGDSGDGDGYDSEGSDQSQY